MLKMQTLLILGLAGAVTFAFASPAGAVSVDNACHNSVNANASQIGTDGSGSAPPSVPAGGSFKLSGLRQQISIPGDIFSDGYDLGLLTTGPNTIPATVRTMIEGTNTRQGQQAAGPSNTSVTTTISDPDGMPGTGDETATDATGTASYPDQTWTASGAGPIQFREDTVTALSTDVGGLVINADVGGFPVQMRCSPGTVSGPDPGVISFLEPAPDFGSSQIKSSCNALHKELKKAKKARKGPKIKKIRREVRKYSC